MARSNPDILRPRPLLSFGILLIGAIGYWFACQPAIWTRGYPPIDPFWQVMVWLWVFPVFASAIYDDKRRRRFWSLVAYSVAVGFVAGGVFNGGLVPRRVSVENMLYGAAFLSPFVLAICWGLERIAQKVLGRFREFEPSDKCKKCDYCIRHLSEPRCPECGEPFDPQWLDDSFSPPRRSKRPWRSWLSIASLTVLCVVSPFAYHELRLRAAMARGQAQAENDWEQGNAVLYEPFLDGPIHQYDLYDIDTGLLVRDVRGGLVQETAAQSYRRVINTKLRRFGAPERPPHILNRADVKAILASTQFQVVRKFPFRIRDNVAVKRDDTYIKITYLHADGGASSFAMSDTGTLVRYAVLPERSDIAILLLEDLLMTISAEGKHLQNVYIENGEVVDWPP